MFISKFKMIIIKKKQFYNTGIYHVYAKYIIVSTLLIKDEDKRMLNVALMVSCDSLYTSYSF